MGYLDDDKEATAGVVTTVATRGSPIPQRIDIIFQRNSSWTIRVPIRNVPENVPAQEWNSFAKEFRTTMAFEQCHRLCTAFPFWFLLFLSLVLIVGAFGLLARSDPIKWPAVGAMFVIAVGCAALTYPAGRYLVHGHDLQVEQAKAFCRDYAYNSFHAKLQTEEKKYFGCCLTYNHMYMDITVVGGTTTRKKNNKTY